MSIAPVFVAGDNEFVVQFHTGGFTVITKEIALTLTSGKILHHKTLTNADKTPTRCRVSGKCQTWKTRPDEFKLPVKHGLRDSFYITPFNADEWEVPK